MSSTLTGPGTTDSWHITTMNPAEAPWHLLLLADPSRERIKRYLPGSTCFGARQTTQFTPSGLGALIGVCVLVPEGDGLHRWELMNMAVSTAWQSKGIGSALLQRAIREMREHGVQQLEVGTGSFGDQLLFYQRLGFRVTDIERDFFLQNYTTPLWERGVQHKDMLKLTLDL
ncbi:MULTISPECIES: GNAT family N-acetyltransferase [Comamonas]|uniref:GNAT family N-acetyltransferase n=1 Tax=Comamonas TaxID=283 RepID=UPI00050DDF39|nr:MULTISPECIES: GNAT family N-acetyltransferase [Comamonas]KGG91553.1 GCN5 family acetyltransferase [Comamonas thiooxydans]KGG97166.1 GCN5 family acetyltransferase [Comamonas thiooxydans]KGH05687.1 GCN5 family acetyltransferase [Comamonas thiooxydans]KGH13553.1 GCN5 family acetyltransferase [Comamonas thiooxydans]TZG11689.1 GNAT family N-acetyltransferase [Comamonas thiooxydans]